MKATGKFCAGGTVDACQVVVMVVVIMVILVIMVAVVIKLIMLIGVVVVIMIEVVLYSVLLNMTSSPIRRTLGAPSCATIRADMNLWGSSAVGKGKRILPLNKTSSGCKHLSGCKLEHGSQVRSISRSLH